MSKKEFESFLKKHESAERENKQINWEGEKERWLSQIETFYGMVGEWLEHYAKENRVEIRFEPLLLNEEHIGSYETKRMRLRMASHEVSFTPIGTLLIAAAGRIDMEGPAGKVRFVLVERDATGIPVRVTESPDDRAQLEKEDFRHGDLRWKIATPHPSLNYIELNEESFFDALLEVMNA